MVSLIDSSVLFSSLPTRHLGLKLVPGRSGFVRRLNHHMLHPFATDIVQISTQSIMATDPSNSTGRRSTHFSSHDETSSKESVQRNDTSIDEDTFSSHTSNSMIHADVVYDCGKRSFDKAPGPNVHIEQASRAETSLSIQYHGLQSQCDPSSATSSRPGLPEIHGSQSTAESPPSYSPMERWYGQSPVEEPLPAYPPPTPPRTPSIPAKKKANAIQSEEKNVSNIQLLHARQKARQVYREGSARQASPRLVTIVECPDEECQDGRDEHCPDVNIHWLIMPSS